MKNITELKLKDNEKNSLLELKEKLLLKFPDAEIILFGSKVREDYEEFSDIDVLILINCKVNTKLEDEIIGLAYDIELEREVVFGLLIESRDFWNSSLARAMPIHWNIDKEGVSV